MKYKVVGILIVLASYSANAQTWFGLGAGGNQAFNYFENSEGVKNETIQGVPGAYVSFYFQAQLPKTRKDPRIQLPTALMHFELSYKKSVMEDKSQALINRWSLDYLSFSAGYRYVFTSKKVISPFLGAGVTADWLLNGVQQRGFEQYNLKNDLNDLNLGIYPEVGVSYTISYQVLGTLGMSYMHGISNLESNGQTSRLSGLRLGVSAFFKLSK